MAVIKWRWTGSKYVAIAVAMGVAAVASLSRGDSFEGVCVRAIDGDTVQVRRDLESVIVRLWGVDCPESRQQFGADAAMFTRAACLGKVVRVRVKTIDRYRRIVGEVSVEGVGDVGDSLLRNGLAWWYSEYAPRDVNKRSLQERARCDKVGMWRVSGNVPPWEWRRRHAA